MHTLADQTARWQFQEKLQALRRDIAGRAGAGQQHQHQARRDQEGAGRDACRAARRCTIRRAPCNGGSARSWWSCRAIAGSGRAACRRPVAISERANTISSELNRTLGRPTTTHEQQFQIASELFVAERSALKALVETDVPAIERELERVGAPYTPGRMPRAGRVNAEPRAHRSPVLRACRGLRRPFACSVVGPVAAGTMN